MIFFRFFLFIVVAFYVAENSQHRHLDVGESSDDVLDLASVDPLLFFHRSRVRTRASVRKMTFPAS